MKRQGSKGKEVIYSHLSMVEYLLPEYKSITISEKQRMFAINTRMLRISTNYPKQGRELI